MRLLPLVFLLACSALDHSASEGESALPGDSANAHDSALDSACEEHDVDVLECSGVLGASEEAESIVASQEGLDGPGWAGEGLTVVRTDAELLTFWETSGLQAASTPLPTVNFATHQVVAFQRDAVTCHSNTRLHGFYALAADGGELAARLDVELQCEQCDTGARWVLDVWITRVASLTTCREGTECVGCP